ncbi:MAG: hypothetical protein J6333_11415, partial [Planctomycetes bacterium]|nr:hypothetical protein [Planctomycetota bacterium]
MRKPQWGAAVALAATLGVVPAAADEAMAATKAAMDGMKIEMEAMRAQLAAEREALRARAGGAPEGLTSANGKATIRIGGDVRIQYGFGWTGGWDRDGYVAYDEPNHDDRNTNFRSSFGGWDVARAELDFAIDLSCDTRGFVALRFDERGAYGRGILDKAYWQWNDIGGSALSLSVGLMDMPFGMWANADMGGYDFDGVDRPLIADPFVRTVNPSLIVPTKVDEDLGRPLGFGDTNRCFPYEDWNGVNVTNLGVVGAYRWDDQFIVKAGIMASEWELPGQGFDRRLTSANANRNVGVIDHVIAVGWNPCWLEGLHLEASYMGRFDEGRGVDLPFEGNPYANDYT